MKATTVWSSELQDAGSWAPEDFLGGPEPDDQLGIDTACHRCGLNPSTAPRKGPGGADRGSVHTALLRLDVESGRYECRDPAACARRAP